jgi:hypothetical protein
MTRNTFLRVVGSTGGAMFQSVCELISQGGELRSQGEIATVFNLEMNRKVSKRSITTSTIRNMETAVKEHANRISNTNSYTTAIPAS